MDLSKEKIMYSNEIVMQFRLTEKWNTDIWLSCSDMVWVCLYRSVFQTQNSCSYSKFGGTSQWIYNRTYKGIFDNKESWSVSLVWVKFSYTNHRYSTLNMERKSLSCGPGYCTLSPICQRILSLRTQTRFIRRLHC